MAKGNSIKFFVYKGEEVPLLQGFSRVESILIAYSRFNVDNDPERLTDTEIIANKKDLRPEEMEEAYRALLSGLKNTYIIPKENLEKRPVKTVMARMDQTVVNPYNIESMQSVAGRLMDSDDIRRGAVLDVYSSIYKRPGEIHDLPENPPFGKYVGISYLEKIKGHDDARHYLNLCIPDGKERCGDMITLGRYLQPKEYDREMVNYAKALKIVYQYDDQIKKASELVASLHPELNPTNVYLALYANIAYELYNLALSDIWQDVSACYYSECSFLKYISPAVFDNSQLDESNDRYKKTQNTDLSWKQRFQYFITDGKPGWFRRKIWDIASKTDKYNIRKQGLGLGQTIPGYVMMAALDAQVFDPFVRAGFLKPEQFADEKATAKTVLNPETAIYAKALSLHFALTRLKRYEMANPGISFPSDSGYFISDDKTARELALLTMADGDMRFPDRTGDIGETYEDALKGRKSSLENNLQVGVQELFFAGSFLGVKPITPSFTMECSGGAFQWVSNFEHFYEPKSPDKADLPETICSANHNPTPPTFFQSIE